MNRDVLEEEEEDLLPVLEQYTVLPIAIYSFVPPGCRRGRLAAALPRPRPSGRLAPASAWAVWPGRSHLSARRHESVYLSLF